MKKFKNNQLGIGHVELFAIGLIIIAISLVGFRVFSAQKSKQSADASGTTNGPAGIKLKKLKTVNNLRAWKKTNIYDLKTLKVVKKVPQNYKYESVTLGYKKGGYFYLDRAQQKKGKYYGIFASHVFREVKGNKAIFGTSVVSKKNNLPITKQKAGGGTCTSSRIWYSGLSSKIVVPLQKVQLELGRKIPFNTAYRTYDEQVCLWNKYGRNPSRVAAPGKSRHNTGLAVDISSEFVNTNWSVFKRHNLCRPVSGEPWHVEPCGIR